MVRIVDIVLITHFQYPLGYLPSLCRILNEDSIWFHESDPAKKNPTLELIHSVLHNTKKLEKLEKQFQCETRPVKQIYKIRIMTKVMTYTPGQGFGDLALVNSQPRAASIKATSDSDFAVLSKKDFNTIIGEEVKKDLESKTMVLKNIPAFNHLTKTTLKKMTFYMDERRFFRGSYLFKEGENIKGLYLIKDGEFEVSKKFKKTLNEKYSGQAFPIKVKRDIK